MFRARERGMSFWPFAISLLLLIVVVILMFDANSKADQWHATAVKAEQTRKETEEANLKLTQQLQSVSADTGFIEGSYTTANAIKAKIKEYGPNLAKSMTATFDETK